MLSFLTSCNQIFLWLIFYFSFTGFSSLIFFDFSSFSFFIIYFYCLFLSFIFLSLFFVHNFYLILNKAMNLWLLLVLINLINLVFVKTCQVVLSVTRGNSAGYLWASTVKSIVFFFLVYLYTKRIPLNVFCSNSLIIPHCFSFSFFSLF